MTLWPLRIRPLDNLIETLCWNAPLARWPKFPTCRTRLIGGGHYKHNHVATTSPDERTNRRHPAPTRGTSVPAGWLILPPPPIFHLTGMDAESGANGNDNHGHDGAGAGDGTHRLSRRRQDHAVEPHPHRAARPQI